MYSKVYRAFSYYRLSKEDYDVITQPQKSTTRIKDESNSITNQKNLISKHIKEQENIVLVSEYMDDGYSGLDFERPGFQQMMLDITKYDVNCIIIKDFSRFGRDYLETSRYIERILPALGIRLISVNDDYDSNRKRTQTDNIILPFKNLMNDNYSRDISKKIRSHMEVKRIDGDYIAPFTVYGYLKSPENSNKLIPDPYAAMVVADIFKMKIEGMSQLRIAEYLNEEGVLAPLPYKEYSGSRFATSFQSKERVLWSENTINRILKNRVYIGDTEQGKVAKVNYKTKKRKEIPKENWIRKENTHEPIVDMDTFLVVQRLLEADTRVSPGKNSLYLFSGLLICADCKQNLIRRTEKHGSKTYEYYICSTHKNQKGCSSHRINEDKLKKIVFKTLNSYINTIVDIEQACKRLDTGVFYQDQKSRMETEREILNSEAENAKKHKLYLYEDYKKGILDADEYHWLKETYSQELEDLTIKIKKAEKKIADYTQNKNLQWIDKFKRYQGFVELERSMLVRLIHHIEVYQNRSLKIVFYNRDEFERLSDLAERPVV